MGLFKRSNSSDDGNNENYEQIELPTSSDLNDDDFPAVEPDMGITPRKTFSAKTSYSIEDAIELMKSLPKDNNEVVVTVVKKTLESTDIKVSDIIDDANSREKRIRAQHKKLEEEIKQLQDKISLRNQQITDLLQDLKETTDVRQRLELALKLDNANQKEAEKPKPAQTSNTFSSTASSSTTSSANSSSPNTTASSTASPVTSSSTTPHSATSGATSNIAKPGVASASSPQHRKP